MNDMNVTAIEQRADQPVAAATPTSIPSKEFTMDLNTILSAALTAAVQQALEPLQQKIRVLEEKAQATNTHVGVLQQRITAVDALTNRINALEFNRTTLPEVVNLVEQTMARHCAHTHAPIAQQLVALEEAVAIPAPTAPGKDNDTRIQALFDLLGTLIDTSPSAVANVQEHGDHQFTPNGALRDWVNQLAEDQADAALRDHNNEFNHNDFIGSYGAIEEEVADTVETALRDHDFSEEIEDAVQSAIRDLTFEVSVS
jgi:hypothetical protein